ncbi:hypothetical protein SAMN06272741_0026 [Streptomyces sp. 2114.4]|nr:hypothetical protein SAMN06272741_0026 [Streptomyces sp. 2114.4]
MWRWLEQAKATGQVEAGVRQGYAVSDEVGALLGEVGGNVAELRRRLAAAERDESAAEEPGARAQTRTESLSPRKYAACSRCGGRTVLYRSADQPLRFVEGLPTGWKPPHMYAARDGEQDQDYGPAGPEDWA